MPKLRLPGVEEVKKETSGKQERISERGLEQSLITGGMGKLV